MKVDFEDKIFMSPLAVPWRCTVCDASGVADPSLLQPDTSNVTLAWVYQEIGAQHRYASPECARRASGLLSTLLLAALRPTR